MTSTYLDMAAMATHVAEHGPVTLSHEEASAVRSALARAASADSFGLAGCRIATAAVEALAIVRAAQEAARFS